MSCVYMHSQYYSVMWIDNSYQMQVSLTTDTVILILIVVSGKRTLGVSGLLWSLSLDLTNSVSGCVFTCVT